MTVPSDPKQNFIITNKKLFYSGVIITWSGVIPALASIYAHFKFMEKGTFTPEILLKKAFLMGGVVVAILGLIMVNKARKVTTNSI